MSQFGMWFTTGFEHILDPQGYDHICYILVLTVMFSFNEWKKVLGIVTAFTIGHSFTLALATLNIIKLPSSLIEVLIALTIIITALIAIVNRNKSIKKIIYYFIPALCFGLIHGMGFSNVLRSMLGREENILMPLFSFNVGLEAGQIIIVFVSLVCGFIAEKIFRVTKKDYVFFVSSAVFGIGSIMALQRISQ